MGYKPDGGPLKLIHILPTKPDSPQFRVQIGSERVPAWLAGLATIVRFLKRGTLRIGLAFRWVSLQVLNGIRLLGTSALGLGGKVILVGRSIRLPAFRFPNLNFLSTITKWVQSLVSVAGRIKNVWAPRKNRRKEMSRLPEPIVQTDPVQENYSTDDFHALQDQLAAQQQELIRVTAQMSELQALVLSQQQVLLHLGKDLEAAEIRSKPQELVVPRKPKTRTTKTAKSQKAPSQKQPPPTPPLGMEVTR